MPKINPITTKQMLHTSHRVTPLNERIGQQKSFFGEGGNMTTRQVPHGTITTHQTGRGVSLLKGPLKGAMKK
jgi:hypothetical protein